MKYKVIKVVAKTVTKAGQNNGKKYVECTLQDDGGNVRIVPVFDSEADKYLKHIAAANGGTLQNATADEPIPEEYATWNYAFDEVFTFPEPMYRVDPNTGTPMMNKFKMPYVRTEVRVLTRYAYDEQLQLLNPNGSPLTALKGWDRVTRGTSVMNSFYMPVSHFQGQASGQSAAVDDPV